MLAMRTYSAMVYAHSLVSTAASSVPLRGHQPWNYTQHYLLIDPGLVSIDSGR